MANHQNLYLQEKSSSLIFFDSKVKDYQQLKNGVQAGVEVFILHPELDGVEQITQTLSQYSRIKDVHIVSHGAPATLYLGNMELSLDTLESYAWQLQTWFDSEPGFLTTTLFLYGCNVAATNTGSEFLEKLHQLTTATVYASSTRVGHSTLDGNWQLDVCYGSAQQPLVTVFQPEVLASYTEVLTTGSDGNYTFYNSKEPGNKGRVVFNDISTTGIPLSVARD